MGFGSYDESEQDEGGEIDTENTVVVENADHDGAVTFESGESTDELVDRLQDMKGGE